MQKLLGRGVRAALLDVEEPGDFTRLETFNIPHPILEQMSGGEGTARGRDEAFLRGRDRIPSRRRSRPGLAWRNRWTQAAAALAVLAALGTLAAIVWQTEAVLRHDPRFVLASSSDIQITGNRVVARRQALRFFAPDMGRSIFQVPLAARQKELQGVDWVRTATVMRLWPNRLRITVVERAPIAFARDGNSIRLVDQDGVLLDLPDAAAQRYSFPVLSGMSASDPASIRAARMQMYLQFLHALDADGEHNSPAVSEVDLSDPEDLRAVFIGRAHDPIVHLGDRDFLPRYRAYRQHLTEWLQEYPQLRSVDMRYGKQIVLDTGAPSDPAEDAPAKDGTTRAAANPPAVDGIQENASGKPAATRAGKVVGRRKPSSSTRARHSYRKHAPERGHPVLHPIAHPISGA